MVGVNKKTINEPIVGELGETDQLVPIHRNRCLPSLKALGPNFGINRIRSPGGDLFRAVIL